MTSRAVILRRAGWQAGGALAGLVVAAHDAPSAFGWAVYLALGVAAGWGFRRLWAAFRVEDPRTTVLAAVIVAFGLRLGVSFFWEAVLPIVGNDTPHHAAGVFFPDAFVRDRSGWTIGRTDGSLLEAFDSAKGDQYGSLLFLTASVYRVFGPQVEHTILPSALAAAFGSAAVLLTWAFTARAFGRPAADLAAWVAALYPDGVLLGAEAMREPFIIAGVAAALYGYVLAKGERTRAAGGWMLAGALICLVVSPPFGLVCALLVAGGWVWERKLAAPAGRSGAVILAGVGVLATVLTVRAWTLIEGSPAGGAGVLAWWLDGVRYEMARLFEASGWAQTVFGQTPAWSHLPLAAGFGLLQPFLPASVMDNTGRLFMRGVMIYRSLGWTLVLPALIYAPLGSIRRDGWRSLSGYLTVALLLATVVISLRFAGDQWDNPRYRTALLPVLAAVVGWAWRGTPGRPPPWLLWAGGLVVVETLVVGWWYAGRFYDIPRLSLFRTIGVGAVAGAVWLLAGLWADRRARARRRLDGA